MANGDAARQIIKLIRPRGKIIERDAVDRVTAVHTRRGKTLFLWNAGRRSNTSGRARLLRIGTRDGLAITCAYDERARLAHVVRDGDEGLIRISDNGRGIRGASVPAIALTAYTRTEDRVQAINAGFQLHVPKPVDPTELVATVASLRTLIA